MPRKRRLIIIAKQRPFDEEQWKQLLTAFAYVLHERRQACEAAAASSTVSANQPSVAETSDDH